MCEHVRGRCGCGAPAHDGSVSRHFSHPKHTQNSAVYLCARRIHEEMTVCELFGPHGAKGLRFVLSVKGLYP